MPIRSRCTRSSRASAVLDCCRSSFGAKVSTWTRPESGAAHLSYASQIGSSGSGNGQFSAPINVAFDGEGNIWATGLGNNRIEKFSSKGAWIASYGTLGSGNEQFSSPGGIGINQTTGNVYVADTNNARILERSTSGTFIKKLWRELFELGGRSPREGSRVIRSAFGWTMAAGPSGEDHGFQIQTENIRGSLHGGDQGVPGQYLFFEVEDAEAAAGRVRQLADGSMGQAPVAAKDYALPERWRERHRQEGPCRRSRYA